MDMDTLDAMVREAIETKKQMAGDWKREFSCDREAPTMTRHDQLMVIAMEECAELAQRLSKAIRFGMDQIQQDAADKPEENPERLTNAQRIYREYWDLRAVLGMCCVDAWANTRESKINERMKQEKVERYFRKSAELGRVSSNLGRDLARLCSGCGATHGACLEYRRMGKVCCPDCLHPKAPTIDEIDPGISAVRPVE